MTPDPKCGRCRHRAPRNICDGHRSPRYGQQVDPTDSCGFFLENPAEEHFTNGLIASVAGDQPTVAIAELEKAIALGLPHDAELQARYFLGSAFNSIAAASNLPAAQMVELPAFARAITEHEISILMDRGGNYNSFVEPLHRARLGLFDLECALVGSVVEERQGLRPAIGYLEEKLKICVHFPSPPMLRTLLKLGGLYADVGESGRAVSCFERIVQAEPVDRLDEQGLEAEVRQMARGNLEILRNRNNASGGSGNGPGCMVLIILLGFVLVAAAVSAAVP